MTFGTFTGISHVAALSNTITCNVYYINSVISIALVKRKHLQQIFRLHTTSNEKIRIMLLDRTNGTLWNCYSNFFTLSNDNRFKIETSEKKPTIFQTEETL